MRKLGELSSEVRERLKRIGKAIEAWEAADPRRVSYVCPTCQDTGFETFERLHEGMGQVYRIGVPCNECLAGARIQERIEAERAKRALPPRTRNERVAEQKQLISAQYSDEDVPF